MQKVVDCSSLLCASADQVAREHNHRKLIGAQNIGPVQCRAIGVVVVDALHCPIVVNVRREMLLKGEVFDIDCMYIYLHHA